MKTEIIKVIVKPNSSKNSIDGIYMGRLRIRVSSPPQKGKANKELIRYISSILGISKKNISIKSGEKSSFKKLAIENLNNTNIISRLFKS
ncbi:MAG: DUF167 domain-containing protein [Actinobacteria bacterium]|nr:DUF167 domain-containing protein [Actinomycetota bacterium]